MEIKENVINISEFNFLYDNVGWGRYEDRVSQSALENSLYSVSVYDNGQIIGYGRLIGDGAAFVYIHDIMVRTDYQGKKVGSKIMSLLLDKVSQYREFNPGIRVYLGASLGKESFYERFGFVSRKDAGLGAGMILKK